jgi:hypothetical protein
VIRGTIQSYSGSVINLRDECPDGTWVLPGESCPVIDPPPPPPPPPPTGGTGPTTPPEPVCTYYEIAYFDIDVETGIWTYLYTDYFEVCVG